LFKNYQTAMMLHQCVSKNRNLLQFTVFVIVVTVIDRVSHDELNSLVF